MKFLFLLVLGGASTLFAAQHRVTVDFRSQFKDGVWQGEWEEREGFPKVPVYHYRWLIPYRETLSQVTEETKQDSKVSIPATLSYTPEYEPMCEGVEVEKAQPRKFQWGEIYPAKRLSAPVILQKHIYQIAEVSLYPMQYMVSEEIGLPLESIDLVFETKYAKAVTTRARMLPEDKKELLDLGVNAQSLNTYPQTVRRDAKATYLIVGPQEYLSDLSTWRLLEEKSSRGITSTTHSLESIQSAGTGASLQEKVRNAVKKHYQEDGTRYVLLIGNGYSLLPTKKFTIGNESIGSDIYFGCFDGDLDLACEVSVGRAPVSNLEEYKLFVQKTLNARSLLARQDKSKTLIFGEKMDQSTLAGNALEQLAKGGSAGAINTKGFPSTAKVDRFNETFSQTFSATTVINKLNEGNYHTVNHMGHAKQSYCMRFSITDIPKLTNTDGFFGITQGCHPGDMKGVNWAQSLIIHPNGGAYAQIANSSYGWYMPGSSDGPSNRHHLVFYDSVFVEGIKEIGRANMRAKERLLSQANSSSTMKKVLVETNLFGDPEFQLLIQ